MQSKPALTPEQREFLRKSIPDFHPDRWEVVPAGSAASQRRFLRIRRTDGSDACILVLWDSADEDWPRFLAIPRELAGRVPFMPAIHAADPASGLILEEDLGDLTLKNLVNDPACTAAETEAAYRDVLVALAEWQKLDPASSPTIAARSMDADTFLWETGYFARHCAADLCGCESLLTAEWEAERQSLAAATAALPQTFLHRDFQSENILLHRNRIRFVDFQGARMGPPAYDVASLLFDPYVPRLDGGAVSRLFAFYTALPLRVASDSRAFYLCAAQRLMQALGAYGNLTLNKGKQRYRAFVPLALARLQQVLGELPEFVAIGRVADECAMRFVW